MKRLTLAILAVMISTSAFADAGDRHGRDNRNDRREDRRDDRRDDRRYDRRDDRYGRDDRRDDRYGRNDRYDRDNRHDRRERDMWDVLIPVIIGGIGGNNGGYNGGYNDGYNGGHHGGHHGGPYGGRVIRCESVGHQARYCFTGLRQITHVRLLRQLSNAACINNGNGYYSTYTAVNGNIAVRNGCRGEFLVRGY